MFYKYETHLHTSEVSKCARSTGAEMARAFNKAGYAGIFVTDHFFNGNCAISTKLDWEQQVDLFMRGYESAKEEGDKLGLDVFFGWEFTLQPYAADFLTYNLDKEFLLAHPYVDRLSIEEYSWLVRKNGGLLIHAHPYREAEYIHYPPNPKPHLVDGVEVNNNISDSPNNNNHLAWELALKYPHLVRISGADIHNADLAGLAGVAFRYRIKDTRHFVDALRAGDAYLIIDGKITDREGKPVEE
ncbi:MAG: histidinol-phosphatase [Clostridiales bacterium]|jgi:hypothetical protein|nr:histidinol-phosphatase [Clostridiales bacterium]